MGAGASARASAGAPEAGAAPTAQRAGRSVQLALCEPEPEPEPEPPGRLAGQRTRLQKWAAHLADPELESSEDEEELLNPVLYVHDTLIPVGGDNLPRWCAARCPVPALCNDPAAA